MVCVKRFLNFCDEGLPYCETESLHSSSWHSRSCYVPDIRLIFTYVSLYSYWLCGEAPALTVSCAFGCPRICENDEGDVRPETPTRFFSSGPIQLHSTVCVHNNAVGHGLGSFLGVKLC